MLSNIEASNTKTIELRKVKASLFDIGIEKCKKQKTKTKTKKTGGFLILLYLNKFIV